MELGDAEIESLIERTEGWPVGLYLGALTLNAGGIEATAGLAFSGDDRLVADYLRSEVLARLSADEVQFLTRTSVVDRLSGPLCDALLDATGSAAVLQSLEHSNLLLVALDDRHEWYRYHGLFRELLRRRARAPRARCGRRRSISAPRTGPRRTDSRRWRSRTRKPGAMPTARPRSS